MLKQLLSRACGYLDQLDVVSAELVLGQELPVHHPRVFQDLHGCQALLGVHVQHFGHHVLSGRSEAEEEGGGHSLPSTPPPPSHGSTQPCPPLRPLGSDLCFSGV